MSQANRSVDFVVRIFLLLIVCGPTLRAQRPATAAEVSFAFQRAGLPVPRSMGHHRVRARASRARSPALRSSVLRSKLRGPAGPTQVRAMMPSLSRAGRL